MGALLIVIPLLAVVLLNLPIGRRLEKLPLAVAGFLFYLQAMAIVVLPTEAWAEPSPIADLFRTSFPVDGLAQTMLLAIGVVGIATALLSSYAAAGKVESKLRLGNLLLLLLAGMNGVVLVHDLVRPVRVPRDHCGRVVRDDRARRHRGRLRGGVQVHAPVRGGDGASAGQHRAALPVGGRAPASRRCTRPCRGRRAGPSPRSRWGCSSPGSP